MIKHPGLAAARRRSNRLFSATRAIFDKLEARTLLSVTLGSDGWTVVGPSGDTRVIYVSNSGGNDSNSGFSTNDPVKTLSKARSLVRNNSADWLLLKKGDTWTNQTLATWNSMGRSADEPILISTYGSGARPVIDSYLADGFSLGGPSAGSGGNIAIMGLKFITSTYNGSNSDGVSGIRMQHTGQNVIIEDCYVGGFKDNVIIGNPTTPIWHAQVRRNVIVDAFHDPSGHAQGIYVSGSTVDILVEENVFDHNGYNDNYPETYSTVFNHSMYFNTGAQGVIVRGNIATRGSLHGTMVRSGGVVSDNLFIRNGVGAMIGNTSSTVTNNVILEGIDVHDVPQGFGIDVELSVPSGVISNNIIAHDLSGYTYNVYGINLSPGSTNFDVSSNIIFDWRRGIINNGYGSINISNNQIQDPDDYHPLIDQRGGSGTYANNVYFSGRTTPFRKSNAWQTFPQWTAATGDSASAMQGLNYVDPNRDMAQYSASLGGPATFDGFINRARAQSKDNWDPRYTSAAAGQYIRDGFQLQSTNGQPLVSVFTYTPTALEGTQQGIFTFYRTGSTSQPLTVNFGLNGIAIPGTDYPNITRSVTFAAGASQVTTTIAPTDDGVPEIAEPAKIYVTPGNGYQIGWPSTASVIIVDANGGDIDNGGSTGGGGGGGGGTGGPHPPRPDIYDDGSGTPVAIGTGLWGEYFDNDDLSVRTNTRLDPTINFDWGAGAPFATMQPDSYSVRWTGKIQAQFTQNYTFYTQVDDGVRLWINDELVIDQWHGRHFPGDANGDGHVDSADFNIMATNFGAIGGMTWAQADFNGDGAVNSSDFNVLATNFGKTDPGGPVEYSAVVTMDAGVKTNIKMEYLEQTGNASAKLWWSSSSIPKEIVPTARLYPPTAVSARSASGSTTGSTTSGAAPGGAAPGNGSGLFSGTGISGGSDLGDLLE